MQHRRQAEDQVRKLNADLERRVAERTAELAERAKDLERSNMELQQFAYVASHDLQEPLRTIASFTQLLAKRYGDKLDDKAREFIAFAVDGSKRMQTLINDLLSFSRVGTQGRRLVSVSTDAVLDAVLKNLKRGIEESRAIITRDPLPIVLADELQLSQILQNLIGNAIKFRRNQAATVHIGAERTASGWNISVRDNGIGVAPEHSERIFVIFQRLHTKTQYPAPALAWPSAKKLPSGTAAAFGWSPHRAAALLSLSASPMEAGMNPRSRPTMNFESTPHPIDILLVEDKRCGRPPHRGSAH